MSRKIHLTPSDKTRAEIAALRARGGKQRSFRLSPELVAAFRNIRERDGDANDMSVLRRAVMMLAAGNGV